MYSRVVGVSEFKHANKNFKGATGVAIPTKFTHTKINKKAQISVLYAINSQQLQICYLEFQESLGSCYGNQI